MYLYVYNCTVMCTQDVSLGFYELQLVNLSKQLLKRTGNICNKLLQYMTKENQDLNKQLRQEYEKIAEKALTTPANTDHLMELKEYIEKVEEKDIFVLEQRMVDSMNRLKILIEHTTFTQSEMRLNAETFDWLTRMPTIFAEHKEIISQTRREAEEALKVNDVVSFLNVCGINRDIYSCVVSVLMKSWRVMPARWKSLSHLEI